jgi:putative hydrolase of HD superfamily
MGSDLQRIIDFIIELDKLKTVLRKTKPVGLERYENSAEHSWQVCLLALLLAPRAIPPVDPLRVVEILLVHDIPEVDSGDQIVYQAPSEARRAAELQAARRLFGLLPAPQAEWCMSRWEEYEARSSDEAVFAYAVDRLMPVLQNLKNDGQSWRENRVPLERVLTVNASVGVALPTVWEHVRVLIAEFAASGRMEQPMNRTKETP